jgi:hypothetical protein
MTKQAATKARAPKTSKAQAKAPKGKKAVRAKAKQTEEDEGEEEERSGSVVKSQYKARYAERGDARNNGDWLASTLKALVLDEDKHLDVDALAKICRANDVDPSYANRSPGWQGRMRMTIGLKLRPIVAAQGGLFVPKGRGKEKLPAPKAFVQKHGQ